MSHDNEAFGATDEYITKVLRCGADGWSSEDKSEVTFAGCGTATGNRHHAAHEKAG